MLTNVDSRKTFDVVNIYENVCGYKVILAANHRSRAVLSLVYGQKIYRLRDHSYETFETDLNRIIDEFPNETIVYVPVSETVTLLYYEYVRSNQTPNLKSLLPPEEAFKLCAEKVKFQKFCEDRRLPVPRSYSTKELRNLGIDFKPMIAKRNVGSGSVGMIRADKPSEKQFVENLDPCKYLIQERVQGADGVHGAFFLRYAGQVTSYYGHRRMRTYPESAGVTVFSKTEYNEQLRDLGAALLQKLGWQGLAMVEFMYDETSEEWKIIELNPRIWGSVLLSEFSGARMLSGYVQACLGMTATQKKIDTDTYIQWLFPFELINLLKGKVAMSEVFKVDRKHTCYVNFTYSTWRRAVLYLLYFTFNWSSVKRFLLKKSRKVDSMRKKQVSVAG